MNYILGCSVTCFARHCSENIKEELRLVHEKKYIVGVTKLDGLIMGQTCDVCGEQTDPATVEMIPLPAAVKFMYKCKVICTSHRISNMYL